MAQTTTERFFRLEYAKILDVKLGFYNAAATMETLQQKVLQELEKDVDIFLDKTEQYGEN